MQKLNTTVHILVGYLTEERYNNTPHDILMITEYGKEESVTEIENYVIQNGYNTKRHKVTLDNMVELITNLKKESELDP